MRLFLIFVTAFAFIQVGVAQDEGPELPASVCDFVAEYAGTDKPVFTDPNFGAFVTKFEDLLQTGAIADVDQDGDLDILSRIAGTGTMGGYALSWSELSEEIPDYAWQENPELYSLYYRWGFDARWLYYGDKWYGVIFKQENLDHAKAVFELTPKGAIISCGFSIKIDRQPEIISSAHQRLPNIDEVCTPLSAEFDLNSERDAIEPGKPLLETDIDYILETIDEGSFQKVDDILFQGDAGISVTSGLYEIDFDNDTKPDRLVRIDLSSMSGRGCEANFFELLPDIDEATVDESKRQKLLAYQGAAAVWGRYPIACLSTKRWQESGGQTFLHTHHFSRAGRPEARWVSTFDANKGQARVCEYKIRPVHTVAYDRSHQPDLKHQEQSHQETLPK